MNKRAAVYIMTNKPNGTLYTGVTSDLLQRTSQHRLKTFKGFSAKYGCDRLVYYEVYEDMPTAIAREKQLKGGSRKKKILLIEGLNPKWEDLFPSIYG